MGRPKLPDAKRESVQVRLTAAHVAGLDELVAVYQVDSPAAEVTRASVLRYLLERELAKRPNARRAKR